MGIKFQAEPGDIARFAFECGHPEGVTGHDYRTHGEAYAALGKVIEAEGHHGSLAACGDEYCTAGAGTVSVLAVEVDPSPVTNVSGSNGAKILAALGEPFSYCGSMDPGTLLERAEARITAAGPSEPYLETRLKELSAIARFAADRGRKVTWG